MRSTLLLVLALAVADQEISLRDAVAIGRTQDEARFDAFNRGYNLSPSGTIDRAEIVTEFRRAVLIMRAHAQQGDYAFGPTDLAKALVPYHGLVTCIVQVRLHPLNTFVKEPAYELYISTGPRSPPIASKTMKREAVYAPGAGPGSGAMAVRLEASFPRTAMEEAAAPLLMVMDEKAELLWQAHIELARYR